MGICILLGTAGCKKSVPPTHIVPDEDPVLFADPTDSRPKVMIFSSIGGGGHTSASQAITSYLGSDYNIQTVHIFSDVLGALDPLRTISRGGVSGEDLYNFFLSRGMFWGGSMWCSMGKWMSRVCSRRLECAIEQFLVKNRPDAIISVVPVINGIIYRAAKRLNIPFAIIAVDLDTSNYLNGLYKPTFEKFYFTIPFDEPAIREIPESAAIAPEKIRVVGFPVRSGFLKKMSKQDVRTQLHIPSNKPVIMVLMGAAGGHATIAYARRLRRMKQPVHIIFCVGRNARLKTALSAMTFPEHISVTLMGFTDKIPELMAASDLLITKTGPTSMCEALMLGIPIIFDHTSSIISWEHMNLAFVKQHGFGRAIRTLRKLPIIAEEMLMDGPIRAQYLTAITSYQWPDVASQIRELVAEMIK